MPDQERKILIVEPDGRDRNRLANYLRKEGFSIETARCLTEAIKKMMASPFSCLIMDVDIPEMKGYEAVSILKNIDSNIKIIMTTKKNSKRLEAKVREQDIFFYFIKSFGNEELLMAINNVFIH